MLCCCCVCSDAEKQKAEGAGAGAAAPTIALSYAGSMANRKRVKEILTEIIPGAKVMPHTFIMLCSALFIV